MAYNNRILKISLIVILLAAAFLCVYSIWNYSNHDNNQAVPAQSITGLNNSFHNERGQMPDIPNHIPGGQLQNSNSTQQRPASNGRIWGGMTSEGAGYAPLLIAYAIIFIAALILIYYLYIYKKRKINPAN